MHTLFCQYNFDNFQTGSIPLRQLVYRVLALPPSMQPLVYDFGQLTDLTEKDYIRQIVTDRVSNLNNYVYTYSYKR